MTRHKRNTSTRILTTANQPRTLFQSIFFKRSPPSTRPNRLKPSQTTCEKPHVLYQREWAEFFGIFL